MNIRLCCKVPTKVDTFSFPNKLFIMKNTQMVQTINFLFLF